MISYKKIFFIILISSFFYAETNALIKDSLFAAVGNKAITRSDIVNEIKIILILNGQSFSEEDRMRIESSAINSTIKRNIKKIEIEKYESLSFNKTDLDVEIKTLAANLGIDSDTFKNIFTANGLDFSLIIDQLQTELLWNSLIFELYKDSLSININEIDEQLKFFQETGESEEFLISEIIIKSVPQDQVNSKIDEIKNNIKIDGFEKVALNYSISETAIRGGDLGWVNENAISEKFKSIIKNTQVGNISEPIFLPEGILLFKLRDKKKVKEFQNLEEVKNRLINSEKTKILKMHSLSHYDNLRRSVTINYY